jgi:ribosomal protein S18 acetylase RimI-like enzyme
MLAMDLRLEPFDPADAASVAGWATTADDVRMWCSRTAAPVPAEVIVGWSRAEDVRAHALFDRAELVGYGELWLDDEEREVELARLIVAPDRRGRGVGSRLVEMLVEIAQTAHADVVLRVAPDNVAAQRCYARAGFLRASAEDEAEWNQGQPAEYVWMTR